MFNWTTLLPFRTSPIQHAHFIAQSQICKNWQRDQEKTKDNRSHTYSLLCMWLIPEVLPLRQKDEPFNLKPKLANERAFAKQTICSLSCSDVPDFICIIWSDPDNDIDPHACSFPQTAGLIITRDKVR